MKLMMTRVLAVVCVMALCCVMMPLSGVVSAESAVFTYKVNADGVSCTLISYIGIATDVVIPEIIEGYRVTGAEEYMFAYDDQITSVIIPGCISSVRGDMFRGCTSLTSVKICDGISYIARYAFRDCTALKTIALPESLQVIGLSAFGNCPSLTDVYFGGSKPGFSIEDYSFDDYGGNDALWDSTWHLNYGADEPCDYTYDITGNHASITGYVGEETDLVLPSMLGGYPVTRIEYDAFADNNAITSVVIPGSVTYIAYQAFMRCESLTSVVIPGSVVEMYAHAFFACTALAHVEFCEGMKMIGYAAFEGCQALTSIVLPSTIVDIREYAFNRCSNLKTIYYRGTVAQRSAISIGESNGMVGQRIDWQMITDMCVSGDFTYMVVNGKACITAYSGSASALVIPETLDGYAVTKIDMEVFRDCETLTSIVIGDNVSQVDQYAFYNCSNLKSVTLPRNMRTIGSNAFGACKALTNVYYKGMASEAASMSIATGNDFLSGATWQYALVELEESDFHYYIADGGAVICDYVGGATELVIPDTLGGYPVTAIGRASFEYKDSITDIQLPETIVTIGNGAFALCHALRTINIPDSVITIEDYAFFYCNRLQPLTLGNHVQTIGYAAFSETYSMKSIGLPASLTYIAENAFDYGRYYEDVYYYGTEETRAAMTIETAGNSGLLYAAWHYVPEEIVSGDFAYRVKDGTAIITEYSGTASDVVIPAVIDGYAVTALGDGLFINDTTVKSVVIPEGVTRIGNNAFMYCNNITDITVPDSVNLIGLRAFYECTSLLSIHIPEGVTVIEDYTFYYCDAFTSIVIPESVTSIGRYAFSSYKVTDITLPKSVTSIAENAFYGCNKLNHVYYSGTRADRMAIQMAPNNSPLTDATWHYLGEVEPDDYTYVVSGEAATLVAYHGIETDADIPDELGGYPVTAIGEGAFSGRSDLVSITIPVSVTVIGANAFSGCDSLTNVYYDGTESDRAGIEIAANNDSLLHAAWHCAEYVNEDDFYYTITNGEVTLLEYRGTDAHVVIPTEIDGYPLTMIGGSAFADNETVTSIAVPGSVVTVGSFAFSGCKQLETITLSEGVQSIGTYAFYGCSNLVSITLPVSITKIQNNAFDETSSLRDVYYAGDEFDRIALTFSGNTYLRNAAWHYVNEEVVSGDYVYRVKNGTAILTEYIGDDAEIVLPSTIDGYPVAAIGEGMFYRTNVVTDVEIPYGVVYLAENAFYYCTSLKNVVISNSVTMIDKNVFRMCSALETIMMGKSVASIGTYAFSGCDALTDVYYSGTEADRGAITIGTVNNSLINAVWHYETDISVADYRYTIANGEVTITEYIGTDTDVVIPDRIEGCPVTTIGSNAFADNAELTSVVIPDSVTTIGSYAFAACDALTVINIPTGVTAIESHTFFECIGLTSVEIPDGVTTICDNAFLDCCNLASVSIPKSVTVIGNNAFVGCNNLVEVHYGGTKIDREAMSINESNTKLLEAAWTYAPMPNVHTFQNGICTHCQLPVSDVLATEHDYANDSELTWDVYQPHASFVTLTFAADSLFENNYDKLYIYDGEGQLVGTYTGSELASKKITVQGDTLTLRFTSDSSVTRYGFEVTSLKSYYAIGDLNGDSRVTTNDIQYLMSAILYGKESLTADQLVIADVNGDGEINMLDCRHALMAVVNAI